MFNLKIRSSWVQSAGGAEKRTNNGITFFVDCFPSFKLMAAL